jgi:hypothetical protein
VILHELYLAKEKELRNAMINTRLPFLTKDLRVTDIHEIVSRAQRKSP